VLSGICVNFDDFPISNKDAAVATPAIAHTVKQPAAMNEEFSLLWLRPLSLGYVWRQKDQHCTCMQCETAELIHVCPVPVLD
jgi:hypothetical protein